MPPAVELARNEYLTSRESDAEMARRVLAGDEWAREALYRRYVRPVWTTALRLVGNHTDAEDIVQDTFVEAFRDLGQLEKLESLRHWLLGIAVHQAQRRFRRRKLLRALGLERGASDASLDLLVTRDASPEVHAELLRVDRALARASVNDRAAWILRHVEGNSLEETAELCRCSLATVKRRIAKANALVVEHASRGGEHE
jgi:RNA polymerase sigma-70 factor, ECF subfamily